MAKAIWPIQRRRRWRWAADLAYNPGINTSTDNAFVGIDLANLNFRRQLATFGNGRQLGWGVVNYLTQAYDAYSNIVGFRCKGSTTSRISTGPSKARHVSSLTQPGLARPSHPACWATRWVGMSNPAIT